MGCQDGSRVGSVREESPVHGRRGRSNEGSGWRGNECSCSQVRGVVTKLLKVLLRMNLMMSMMGSNRDWKWCSSLKMGMRGKGVNSRGSKGVTMRNWDRNSVSMERLVSCWGFE